LNQSLESEFCDVFIVLSDLRCVDDIEQFPDVVRMQLVLLDDIFHHLMARRLTEVYFKDGKELEFVTLHLRLIRE